MSRSPAAPDGTAPAGPRQGLRILSLDGGGYLGLATACFIRGIESHFGLRFHDRFDFFCGTSTGAILALGLAAGKTGEELVSLYKMLGPRVFCRPRPRWGIFFRAKYDNVALRAVLRDQFGELTLADIQQKGKAVLVTAFNVTSGNPRLFKTDHSDNLTRDGDLTLVDVALASTAAPMYFPVVSVTNPRDSVTEAFCDGGVVANHPTLLAYAEAVSEFRANPAEIRILSLSTPRKHLGEGSVAARSLDRGWLSWRKTLPDILIDSNSKIAHEVLRRIVESYSPDERPLYERVLLHNAHSLAMDCADEAATNELESLGASAAGANDTRGRLQPIIKEPTHG